MKLIVLPVLLIVLMSITVFSQREKSQTNPATPNFEGTWIIDEKKSIFFSRDDVDDQTKESYQDYVLKISQQESEIKIIKSFSFKGNESEHTIILFTDKRGEENIYSYPKYKYSDDFKEITIWLVETKIKSESFLKKGKLIRNGSFTGDVGSPSFRVEKSHLVKEIYTLSDDAKTLTLETDLQILDSPRYITSQMSKLIFRKKGS